MQDYAAEGKALARVDGKVVFIEGAVPGDVVDVQLKKIKPIGQKALWCPLDPIPKTGCNPFVRILVFVAVVSGTCFHMQNSWCIDNNE